jgi:hypothetical protein
MHHAAAVVHHQQAARFHREASRHYQIGKDYAHAAHQALTAHGHALRAMEHGQTASAHYVAHEHSPLPNYLTRSSGEPMSTALASRIILTVAEHHAIAADHHDASGLHHAQAGKHSVAEHYIRANHATKEALKHGEHALFHADQAAMHHMEHYGSRSRAEPDMTLDLDCVNATD